MQNNRNYNTPYDDAFKTMLATCTRMIIPVINEAFGESYKGDELIIRTSEEFFIDNGDGAESRLSTDSVFTIYGYGNDRKRYHIECQSTVDGTMLIRMFQYDTQIALGDSDVDKQSGTLTVRFPHSAILYLRDTGNTPDYSIIRIETPDGSTSYKVRNIQVRQYTMEELFDRDLLFLIPFHIFSFEKHFRVIEKSEDAIIELIDHYAEIRSRLDSMTDSGAITEYEKHAIIDMSRRVFLSITEKHENINDKAGDVMGGEVLEFEAKKIHDEGKAEGRAEGKAEVIEKLIEEKGFTLKEACSIAGISEDEYRSYIVKSQK